MSERRFWLFPVFGLLTGAVLAILILGLDRAAYRYGYQSAVAGHQTATTVAQDLSRLGRERLECDRQVQIFMTTKDIVELERARHIIDWFNCAVGRRLPPA